MILAGTTLQSATRAQEPVRESLARAAASAGKREINATDYNILAGPLRLKLHGKADIEFNDNVNVADPAAPVAPEADLFIRPGVDLVGTWQVTQLNVLSVRLGASYEFSLNDTRESAASPFTIAPDSEIGFDIFVGDLRINLHDRFAVENNPASQATLSNTAGYTRFTNQSGISLLWDLNDVVLASGYDFVIDRYKGDDFQLNDRDTHQISASAAFLINETTTTGLQGSLSLATHRDRDGLDQTSWTVGPFIQAQLTSYTRILLAGGVQQVDTKGSTDRGSTNGYYWTAGIYNRLNSAYTHSLSMGHEQQLGLGVEVVEIDYIRYGGSWHLNRHIALGIGAAYEHYEELACFLNEALDRWSFSLALACRVTQRLASELRYSYVSKDSDLLMRDYRQNVVSLSFSYDF